LKSGADIEGEKRWGQGKKVPKVKGLAKEPKRFPVGCRDNSGGMGDSRAMPYCYYALMRKREGDIQKVLAKGASFRSQEKEMRKGESGRE